MIEIGQNAPDFCLPNQDGVEMCLRDLAGSWIVLYFYPKDNTPGCTTEACDFTQNKSKFTTNNTIILGVSSDNMQKHQSFIKKHNLDITLLSDESTAMMQDYGVWILKKNYGKEYMGIVRTTYIIDPNATVVASWSNVKVRTKRKKDGKVLERLHVDLVYEKLLKLQADATQ